MYTHEFSKILFHYSFFGGIPVLFIPQSIKAAYVAVWFLSLIVIAAISGALIYMRNPLPSTKDIIRSINEEHQRALRLEQTLQTSCGHLTRLSSVVVTCSRCGEKFLRLQNISVVSCPGCGKTVFRQREPSAICDIDGSRVSKEQLTDCLYSYRSCRKRKESNTIYLDDNDGINDEE